MAKAPIECLEICLAHSSAGHRITGLSGNINALCTSCLKVTKMTSYTLKELPILRLHQTDGN